MDKLRKFLTCVHLILSTVVAYFIHYYMIVGGPDILRPLVHPFWDLELYYQIFPLIAVLVSLGITYLYMKAVRVKAPFLKALFSTLMGTVLFWASCIGLIYMLAPGLSNM